jgi:hypothetical protein
MGALPPMKMPSEAPFSEEYPSVLTGKGKFE